MKIEIMYSFAQQGRKMQYQIVGPDDVETMDALIAEDASIAYAYRSQLGTYDSTYSKTIKELI